MYLRELREKTTSKTPEQKQSYHEVAAQIAIGKIDIWQCAYITMPEIMCSD